MPAEGLLFFPLSPQHHQSDAERRVIATAAAQSPSVVKTSDRDGVTSVS
jgi:hypothetical protein